LRLLAILPLIFITSIFPALKAGCSTDPGWPVGCPHGEEILPNIADPDTPGAYFDFSEGKLVYGDEGKKNGDIYLEKTLLAGNPALGIELHDDLADSLLYKRTAPSLDWKSQPNPDTPVRLSIYNGHCVWVRTSEKKIGKIKILQTDSNTDVSSFNWIKFEWIFQPDGTGDFPAPPEPESATSK
jgi:hypothetical protein